MPRRTFNVRYTPAAQSVLALVFTTAGLFAVSTADEPPPLLPPAAEAEAPEPPPDLRPVTDDEWRAINGEAPLVAALPERPKPSTTANPSESGKNRRGRGRRDRIENEAASPDVPPLVEEPDNETTASTADSYSLLDRILRNWIISQLPDEYENKKKWDRKERVAVGLKVELDGAQLETRRRYKEVNHGTWTKYKITPIDPEKEFQFALENVRNVGDGKIVFDLILIAKATVFGRVAQWERGVQLYNVCAEADVQFKLITRGECDIYLDPRRLPPDIRIEPKVNDADLQLLSFRLKRVSAAKGPIVKMLSATVREMAEDAIQENRKKLVEKMNKQIDKQKDKLVLSAAKAFESTWGESLSKAIEKTKAASKPDPANKK